MTNHSSKLTTRSSQIVTTRPQGSGSKRVAKKMRKRPQKRSLLSSILAMTLLLSNAGLFMAFGWMSVLFIFKPEKVIWVNKYLPTWAQIPLNNNDRPYTLSEIQILLTQQQRTPGEILYLDDEQNNLFLLPIFQARPNCQSNCQFLVELRIYQRTEDENFQSQPDTYYRLASQLPITGPTVSVLETGVDETPSESDSPVHLPLTQVKAFADPTLSSGFWFHVWGETQHKDKPFSYGQIVHYNPSRSSLQQLLTWTNPNGKLPQWQQVTGSKVKELVIDQTVDLEPQLQVYQIKSSQLVANSLQLEAINIKKPALPAFAFQQSLFLARNGLWSPALAWLETFQKQQKNPLPPAAQAQIDFIRLHSQFTKTHANQTWANPSQQVLADLIDGRWEKAIQVFAASSNNAQEIATLLKADQGRLWNRATAALRVNPTRRSVLGWLTLILAAQRGEERAKSWLQSQPNVNPTTLLYIHSLLANLYGETTNTEFSSHSSQIVGGVKQVSQVNENDWLPLDTATNLTLTDNQVWYEIDVSSFYDGKSWLNYPFTKLNLTSIKSSKLLANILGLSSQSSIQIVVWLENGEQQITTNATIKAFQLQGGGLRLLAAGPLIPQIQDTSLYPQPLALTTTALEWVQPSPITIKEVSQQDTGKVQNILSTVWRSLQESGEITTQSVPSFSEMATLMWDWPVQLIDLTGDGQQEIVLTISASAIASLQQSAGDVSEAVDGEVRPRTLIFSDRGKVIYSDLAPKSQQVLIAIAQLAEGQSLALLVEDAHRYSLKRWSSNKGLFE
ncbi:hypothetical protein H6G73_20600 [Richelia sinica FACHB-800]|nr:hypothetical protein [Richelia sinica]MBD2666837.1 hypothetical protein [Richelia sinica FACHB-800]